MSSKPAKEKYVTVTLFKKEITGIHQKFDTSFSTLDQKIDRLEQKMDASDSRLDQKIDRLEQKMDDTDSRLDQKIDNLALTLVNTNQRLERVEYALENTVATKADLAVVLDRIDHVLKKVSVFDVEEDVQSFQLQEVRRKVDDHEKRLALIESKSN